MSDEVKLLPCEDELVNVIADVLARLPVRDFEGVRLNQHELDALRRREAARAILAAIEATRPTDTTGLK